MNPNCLFAFCLSDFYADFISIIIQPFVRQICLYIWRKVVKYNAWKFRKYVQQKTLQDKAD